MEEDDKGSKRKTAGNFLRRLGWAMLALLFLVTGLGIGIVYFWQATHPSQSSTNQSQSSKLQGTKLTNFTPTKSVPKLQTIDLSSGNGAAVKADSTITVVYSGAVASSGIIFQSSADTGQPLTTKLDQVIKGWQEGLIGAKAGGQRRILIPAAQAYGANPPPGSGIPPNADLVFDVTVLEVK